MEFMVEHESPLREAAVQIALTWLEQLRPKYEHLQRSERLKVLQVRYQALIAEEVNRRAYDHYVFLPGGGRKEFDAQPSAPPGMKLKEKPQPEFDAYPNKLLDPRKIFLDGQGPGVGDPREQIRILQKIKFYEDQVDAIPNMTDEQKERVKKIYRHALIRDRGVI